MGERVERGDPIHYVDTIRMNWDRLGKTRHVITVVIGGQASWVENTWAQVQRWEEERPLEETACATLLCACQSSWSRVPHLTGLSLPTLVGHESSSPFIPHLQLGTTREESPGKHREVTTQGIQWLTGWTLEVSHPQSVFFLRVGFFLLPPLPVHLLHACSLSHVSKPSSLFLACFCQFLQKSKLCKFFCFQLLPDESLFLFESLFLVECELWDKGDL